MPNADILKIISNFFQELNKKGFKSDKEKQAKKEYIKKEKSNIFNLLPLSKPKDKEQLLGNFPNQFNFITAQFEKAKQLKGRLKAQSLTYEQLKEYFGKYNDPIISTIKYDGEFNIAVFDFEKLGDNVLIINDYQRVRYNFIISHRLNDILRDYVLKTDKGNDEITQAVLVGELFAIDTETGVHLQREKVLSIIKKPETMQREYQIRYAVFDIAEINNKDMVKANNYRERVLLIQDIFNVENDFIIPVVAKYGNFSVIEQMWKDHILTQNLNMLREGLMIKKNGYIKVKPYYNIDCVILGYWLEGELIKVGSVNSILMGLMNEQGNFQTLGKMTFARDSRSRKSSVSDDIKKEWFSKLEKTKVEQVINYKGDKIQMVRPIYIFEVSYERALIRPAEEEKQLVLKYDETMQKYKEQPLKPSISLMSMKFVEIREDKVISVKDLRLEQIPEWVAYMENL